MEHSGIRGRFSGMPPQRGGLQGAAEGRTTDLRTDVSEKRPYLPEARRGRALQDKAPTWTGGSPALVPFVTFCRSDPFLIS
jgi:hypothetical protein